MNRRKFLLHVAQASAFISYGVPTQVALSATFVSNKKLIALPYFLDTLIPEDTTPSATQLELHKTLISHAKHIENYTTLLELGCQWLDLQAQQAFITPFNKLPQSAADKIVSIAANSSNNTIPNMFFERVKSDVFAFYYSHPASWPGLGFDTPPQPLGYPDFTQPIEVKP